MGGSEETNVTIETVQANEYIGLKGEVNNKLKRQKMLELKQNDR
jgi:hypothetical protein